MKTGQASSRLMVGTLFGIGLGLGVAVAALADDVILGVIAGASFIAITRSLIKLWTGR
jgi:hypothetical protein